MCIPDIGNVQTVEDIARVLSEIGENMIPCSKVEGRKRYERKSSTIFNTNVLLSTFSKTLRLSFVVRETAWIRT